MHNFEGNFCLYCKKTHKTGDKKICEEYIVEATIQNKIRLDKSVAYTAKETLGYRSDVSVARGAENKGGQKKKKVYR